MKCIQVTSDTSGPQLTDLSPPVDLAEGEIRIRVAWSCLNYKDALACQGHKGVISKLPLIPGIDAAGTVIESKSDTFRVGDEIIVTSHGFGTSRDGGWGTEATLPAEIAIRLPKGLSPRAAMMHGTAGITAAACVHELLHNGVEPDQGPIVVTGATGGVGIQAVALLSKLGFEVAAVTGKQEAHELLKEIGAAHVLPRSEFTGSDKPLLKAKWAGSVDCVGGEMLSNIVRSTQPLGCVTCCGLVGGADLPLTVYPFILRGVKLIGIDSAECPIERNLSLWNHLAGDWQFQLPQKCVQEVQLETLPVQIESISKGQLLGRVLVRLI